jgi:hypothetical protein
VVEPGDDVVEIGGARRVLVAALLALAEQPLPEQQGQSPHDRGGVAVDRGGDLVGAPAPLGGTPEEEQHFQLLDRIDVLMQKAVDVLGKAAHLWPALTRGSAPP